jgi:hypothetical protein
LFFFGEGLLDVGTFGDEFAEVGGPVFAGALLHLLVLFVFGGAGVDESGVVGLVGGRLDGNGESGGGAGCVLGSWRRTASPKVYSAMDQGRLRGSRLVDPESRAEARATRRLEVRAQGTGLRVVVSSPLAHSVVPG